MNDKSYIDMVSFAAEVLTMAEFDDYNVKFGAAMMIMYQFEMINQLENIIRDIDEALENQPSYRPN